MSDVGPLLLPLGAFVAGLALGVLFTAWIAVRWVLGDFGK